MITQIYDFNGRLLGKVGIVNFTIYPKWKHSLIASAATENKVAAPVTTTAAPTKGDSVILTGLVDDELNGRSAVVLRPDSRQAGRWIVKVEPDKKLLSVLEKSLRLKNTVES